MDRVVEMVLWDQADLAAAEMQTIQDNQVQETEAAAEAAAEKESKEVMEVLELCT